MPKTLVIAEKPSVARDIAKSLGNFEDFEGFLENDHFVIAWAVGHLLEFLEPEDMNPVYKSWKLEDLPILPDPFQLKPKQGQTKLLGTLKKLAKRPDVTEVVNACDAGREGELIFREILDFIGANKPTRRLWLQSMTPGAIRKGFEGLRPGKEFDRLGAAAQCRSEADWLIGINATRALTRRMKLRSEHSAWSAGRVQTPTLALLVDRELEVLRHRPQPFWRIQGRFHAAQHEYEGTWFDANFKADADNPGKDDWITDEAKLEAILSAVRGQSGTASETRKPSSETPPPLFDLTSLQREANRRMGMSARRTLQAAQRLYEQYKLLTYPRTDSRCLPSDYTQHVDQVINQFASSDGPFQAAARTLQKQKGGLLNTKRIFDDTAVSDHFAIIPTTEMAPHGLHGDEAKIYDLVVRRFLAAFHPNALWTKVERTTDIQGHLFRTRVRYLTEPGWREVWGKEAEEDSPLPPLVPSQDNAAGVPARNLAAGGVEDETKPPPRITEARLLSLMEHAGKQVEDDNLSQILSDKGLGTPATRADIIENLVAKQYIIRAERALKATSKGILLIDLLRRIQVERLASPELTGELEKHLREVEGGKRTRQFFMGEISDYTREIVERAKEFDYDDIYRNDAALGPCPVCKKRKVFERARFYACSGNTGKNEGECAFSVWKEKGGRYLDRPTMEELLQKGETPPVEGFVNKRGDGYKAALKLNLESGAVEIVGDKNGAPLEGAIELPVSHEPVATCPLDPNCRVMETPTHFECEATCVRHNPKLKHGSSLPRIVCKREVTREEAAHYFATGKTVLIDDFTSRYGRPFKAFLVLKPSGRHSFEFPPREPRKGKGGGRFKKAEEAGAAVAVKKTPAKGRAQIAAKEKTTARGAAKSKTTAKGAVKEKAAAKGTAKEKAPAKRARKSAGTSAPARKSVSAVRRTAARKDEALVPANGGRATQPLG